MKKFLFLETPGCTDFGRNEARKTTDQHVAVMAVTVLPMQ
jgi:hypothetical protein